MTSIRNWNFSCKRTKVNCINFIFITSCLPHKLRIILIGVSITEYIKRFNIIFWSQTNKLLSFTIFYCFSYLFLPLQAYDMFDLKTFHWIVLLTSVFRLAKQPKLCLVNDFYQHKSWLLSQNEKIAT